VTALEPYPGGAPDAGLEVCVARSVPDIGQADDLYTQMVVQLKSSAIGSALPVQRRRNSKRPSGSRNASDLTRRGVQVPSCARAR